ncbi:hypothetical protein [Nocardia transvalensis]|uniref:hypothetical protein n=1 Tax=Nocardia transvalensis TaxID=37333 RepID=UPI0005932C1E|nr:hypothetical protein [Nocardia transvalensis]
MPLIARRGVARTLRLVLAVRQPALVGPVAFTRFRVALAGLPLLGGDHRIAVLVQLHAERLLFAIVSGHRQLQLAVGAHLELQMLTSDIEFGLGRPTRVLRLRNLLKLPHRSVEALLNHPGQRRNPLRQGLA